MASTRTVTLLGGLGLLVATGCGGKVLFDSSAGSGAVGGSLPGAGGSVSTTSVSTTVTSTSITSSNIVGTPTSCPDEDPISGAPCDLEGLSCSLPDQCCSPTATCSNGKWGISAPDCASICLPCSDGNKDLECAADAVCVFTVGEVSGSSRCRPDPCGNEPLLCTCASSVCTNAQCTKTSQDTRQVVCDAFVD